MSRRSWFSKFTTSPKYYLLNLSISWEKDRENNYLQFFLTLQFHGSFFPKNCGITHRSSHSRHSSLFKFSFFLEKVSHSTDDNRSNDSFSRNFHKHVSKRRMFTWKNLFDKFSETSSSTHNLYIHGKFVTV